MMILRVPVHITAHSYIEHSQQPTRIVHYTDTAIWHFWYYSFDRLYNDQLTSVVKTHGVGCGRDGWVWDERDDQL